MDSDTPANSLLHKAIGKWLVVEKCPRTAGATGGHHSIQYRVRHTANGHRAFLKAIDLFSDANATDLYNLEAALRNHRYEASLLKICEERSMDGVVRSLDSGVHVERIHQFQVAVPYIIFEEAEGDVRTHDRAQSFDLSWRLRIFHGLCVAMRQLHTAEIAHQDVKPSNLLVFNGTKSKIADLGRATMKSNPSFFELPEHVGDRNYWPLELLYQDQTPVNWLERRLGADFFMMGCVLTFLLTDSSFLTLLFEKVDRRFWPDVWKGSYQEAMPHLLTALATVTVEIRESLPAEFSQELIDVISCFTHPDPKKRGDGRSILRGTLSTDPIDGLAAQYDLEYIISRIDHMARRAQIVYCPSPKSPTKRRFLDLFTQR